MFGIVKRMNINKDLMGIYHYSGKADVSQAESAWEIFHQRKVKVNASDFESIDYRTAAKRPLNSRLNGSSFGTALGISRPN